MAIAYAGQARQTGASVSSFSLSADAGSGTNRLLLVFLLQRSITLQDVTAITYNGVSLTRAGSAADNTVPTTKLRAEVYYLANPSSGSNTLSVTYSGVVQQYECQVAVFNGADISNPYVGANTATGQDAAPAVSLDPGSVNGCLLAAGVIHEAATALSTGSGETANFNNDNGAWVTSSEYAIQTTAAAQSMDWSAPSSDYWAAAGGIFRADANDAPTVALNTADDAELDDTPTLEFTGTDADNDDVRYNIQISDSPDFLSGSNWLEGTDLSTNGGLHENGMASLTWEGHYHVDDRFGISFMGHGGILDKIAIALGTDDPLTDGYALVRVYAHQGTYGTNSAPLNPADPADTPTPGWLAQSALMYLDPTELAVFGWKEFTFSGANRIRLENGVPYVLVVDWWPNSGVYGNLIELSTVDPSAHAGNVWIDSNSANYGVYSAGDISFRVFETAILLDKISGTDAGFENTVTPADSDPFTSGEKIAFTVQSGDALTPGATYYWRVRGSDPGGSNQWGAWATARSFTVAAGGAIQGSAAGTSSASGTLTGQGELVGSAAGAATASAALTGLGDLSGAAAGAATASGTLGNAGSVGDLSGTAAGAASASGTLTGQGALVGASAGLSTCSGNLIGTGALSGAAAGASSASGSLAGVGALAGASVGASSASATLTGQGALSGLAAGVASASGTIGTQDSLSGVAAGTSFATGTLTGLGALDGSAAGVTTANATLVGYGALSGLAAGVANAYASAGGEAFISGTAAGTSSASATLSGDGYISGAAAGAGSASGLLTATGSLVGAAAGVAVANATLAGLGALIGLASGVGLANGNLTYWLPVTPIITVTVPGRSPVLTVTGRDVTGIVTEHAKIEVDR